MRRYIQRDPSMIKLRSLQKLGGGTGRPWCKMSAFVKLFGRLHDDPIRTRRRQAYEMHQWTKSREVERLRRGRLCEADGAFKRVTPLPAAHTTGTCWYGS